jgi:SAM-dependent methyltransferase
VNIDTKPADQELKKETRRYWDRHPNAYEIGKAYGPGTKEFFEVIEGHRYKVEPCIREMADFGSWKGMRVVEIGCGIATDLRQFAKAGARVVGVDLTSHGIELAKKNFKAFGLSGDFVIADAEFLPFREDTFDLAYSHGVIHCTPDTPKAVVEIHRVLQEGGEARVMVYHRNSYHIRVMCRLVYIPILKVLLRLFPHGKLPSALDSMLPALIRSMYLILVERGFSADLVYTLSSDPPWPGAGNYNPLARFYTEDEFLNLFAGFRQRSSFLRQLYYLDFLPDSFRRWLERRLGFFLYIRAKK